MSEESDSNLGKETRVKEILEKGFGEVEFEEIKIGFKKTHEDLELSEDLTDDDLMEFLNLDFIADVLKTEEFGNLDLEETLSDVITREKKERPRNEDFYKVEDNIEEGYEVNAYDTRDAYNEFPKDDYNDGFVDIDDINISLGTERDRRNERSMLEISGFKDTDAEKKREDKLRFWD